MENKKISVIVFDLGNVLIPFDYSIMISRMNEVKQGMGERFMQLYKDNYSFHRSFERGDVSQADFLAEMLRHCDGSLDEETFCRYYSEIFTVNEDVASLLPVLKEKGYKIVLLSNTNEIHRQYGYRQYDFFKYFDKLVLSHEAGAVKPEPAIYRAVEAYTGYPPEEHVFIDDVEDYAGGARAMGWKAIHFKGYDSLVDELKKLNVL